jgi:hypothetical protein
VRIWYWKKEKTTKLQSKKKLVVIILKITLKLMHDAHKVEIA